MVDKRDMSALDEDLYDEDEEDTLKDRYLTFQIAEEDYAIEIQYVIEIIGIQNITDVPDMPDFVKGVINLRGRVIPVIDVRLRFHMQERDYDDRTCVIIVTINDSDVGLVVDFVKEVIAIPEENVSPPPKVNRGRSSRYIQGIGRVGESVKILLDVQKLLYEEEIQQLNDNAQAQAS
jgi:purine-binding chemotaxis protein CheW